MTMNRWLLGVCAIALVIGSAGSSGAKMTGITGKSAGCNPCHSGGTAPTVTITGPTSVTVGSTNEYLLQVFDVGSQHYGGLDASATGGTLATGGSYSTGTQLSSGEITHTAAKGSDGTSVKFSFFWTAPISTGAYALQAAGAAVNGDGGTGGDNWSTTSFSITVNPAPTPTLTGGTTPTASPTPTPTDAAATVTPTPTITPTPDPCPSAHCLDCSDICNCADAKPGVCIGYCGAGVCTDVGGACACQPTLDHFTCYKTGPTKGSIKFGGRPNPPGVGLEDQFGASTVAVKKSKFLCAPTNKNGEDPTAPTHAEHLEGYQIKPAEKRVLPTNLTVTNQFGAIQVDAKKESHLLVPTVKSLTAPPSLPGSFVVDHFQCYKAKLSKGAPKFLPILGVTIQDQFRTMQVDVKKPRYLCVPVDKNGEGIHDSVSHLMCYQVKQVKGDPKFVKVIGAYVQNQLAAEQLDVKTPSELCVPATLSP